MAKAKGKSNSAKSGMREVTGSALNLWNVVFFVSGMLLMGLVHLAISSADHGKERPPANSVSQLNSHVPKQSGSGATAKLKPWGELEITPFVLDRPGEMFETNTAQPRLSAGTF